MGGNQIDEYTYSTWPGLYNYIRNHRSVEVEKEKDYEENYSDREGS